MSTTTANTTQKVARTFYLSFGAILAVFFVYGTIQGYINAKAKEKEAAKVITELEQIEASDATDASKSRKWLELVYSNPDATKAALTRRSEGYLIDRVRYHVQAGYNISEPLSAIVFEKAAEASCLAYVRQVDERSSTFNADNYNAYLMATSEFATWKPYLGNYPQMLASCAYRFQFMQRRHDDQIAKERALDEKIRDVGAAAGSASKQVGEWWKSATKPIADAANEFKAGYQSGN